MQEQGYTKKKNDERIKYLLEQYSKGKNIKNKETKKKKLISKTGKQHYLIKDWSSRWCWLHSAITWSNRSLYKIIVKEKIKLEIAWQCNWREREDNGNVKSWGEVENAIGIHHASREKFHIILSKDTLETWSK